MRRIYDNILTLEITTNRLVTELFSGNYRSSFQGSGIEVEDLRPYEAGDDARLIDWTATAKLNEPYIKKFHETRELLTFVVVDVSSSMLFSSQPNVRKSDLALEAAALLLFSAVKNNESVGAVIFSDVIKHVIPPRKGRRHALRILREITNCYADKSRKTGDFKLALEYIDKTITKHHICFAITDQEVWDEKTKKALSIANLKNDFVYVHVEDPFEKEIIDDSRLLLEDGELGTTGEFNLADTRLRKKYASLRHKKEVARTDTLKSLNIDCVALSTDKEVFPEFLKLFKFRQRRKRRI